MSSLTCLKQVYILAVVLLKLKDSVFSYFKCALCKLLNCYWMLIGGSTSPE